MEEKKNLFFDDLEIGHEFIPYEFTMTEETIRKYIVAIKDNNPLYSNKEAGEKSPYGGIIAPPTSAAIYCLPAYKTEGVTPPGCVHARQKFEFVKPVLPGDQLKVIARVKDKFIRKERKFVIFDEITANQKGEVVARSEIMIIWSK